MKKITIGIPIIGYIIMMSIIIACSNKKKEVAKPEDDFLKVPTYETPKETPKETQTYTPASTYTPIFNTQASSMTPTYWYITFEEVIGTGKDWNSIDWHWAVKLRTPYFDFVEAKMDLPPQVTGKVYYDFLVQINKESYDSFFKFKELYHPKN